jgi:hypothetical protein
MLGSIGWCGMCWGWGWKAAPTPTDCRLLVDARDLGREDLSFREDVETVDVVSRRFGSSSDFSVGDCDRAMLTNCCARLVRKGASQASQLTLDQSIFWSH